MNIGDKLPEVLGIDAAGHEIKASDFAGRKVIIYFYPKDSTPGCTAEACSLRDGYAQLQQMGYALLGVSPDSQASHQKFAAKYTLPFPLISDADHTLAEAFGVWQLKKMAGREYMGVVRTTFVADATGTITDIVRKVDTKNAADQLFKLLDDRYDINPG